tara:strand:- start:2242 stop:2415 length:174 start_codon:yes stop_codon:yes gene_type:complete
MTRILDFLFWAVSALFLVSAAKLFILEMGDVGMIAGLACVATSILMFMAAIYQIARD